MEKPPKDNAIKAFVFSLIGLLFAWVLGISLLLGIYGYFLARDTDLDYEEGYLPARYQGLVTAAKIIGMICVVFVCLAVIVLVIGAGMHFLF